MSEISHDLIVVIVNQGYSDELISAAREAGARGGTVVSARGMTHQGPIKFFGLSLQEDKEIIYILVLREHKLRIMQCVSRDYGISTQAEGIVFSLPVDSVAGFSFGAPESGPDAASGGAENRNPEKAERSGMERM